MGAPSSALLDFLTSLQVDPGTCTDFTADPVGTMTAAGLSAEEQAIVQSGDLDRLEAALGHESDFAPLLDVPRPRGVRGSSALVSTAVGGSLTVVGTGMTAARTSRLRRAPRSRRPTRSSTSSPSRSRHGCSSGSTRAPARSPPHYGDAKPRWETYDEIAEALLASVRAGARLCAVFYGHPGILVDAVAPGRRTSAGGGLPHPDAAGGLGPRLSLYRPQPRPRPIRSRLVRGDRLSAPPAAAGRRCDACSLAAGHDRRSARGARRARGAAAAARRVPLPVLSGGARDDRLQGLARTRFPARSSVGSSSDGSQPISCRAPRRSCCLRSWSRRSIARCSSSCGSERSRPTPEASPRRSALLSRRRFDQAAVERLLAAAACADSAVAPFAS